MTNGYDLVVHVDVHVLKGIVPTILAFFKNCCKVAKLKDDIIKHRLNPRFRRLKLL